MRVVRYTFDICIRKSYPHDVYTLASVLEKQIMGCNGVCGCEVKSSHVERCNAVDIDKVIKEQNAPASFNAETGDGHFKVQVVEDN